MNKLAKPSAVLGFIFLYIFAISISTNIPANESFLNHSQGDSTGYFKDNPAHLFSHTNQSFENVCSFTSANFSDSKRFFKSYLSFVQVAENLMESQFVQYTVADLSFPLKFDAKDIIYPFHFFY